MSSTSHARAELVKGANLPYNLQKYIANMVYVGVVAYLLEIEMEQIKDALVVEFRRQDQADRAELGHGHARLRLGQGQLINDQPYRVAAHDRL